MVTPPTCTGLSSATGVKFELPRVEGEKYRRLTAENERVKALFNTAKDMGITYGKPFAFKKNETPERYKARMIQEHGIGR